MQNCPDPSANCAEVGNPCLGCAALSQASQWVTSRVLTRRERVEAVGVPGWFILSIQTETILVHMCCNMAEIGSPALEHRKRSVLS